MAKGNTLLRLLFAVGFLAALPATCYAQLSGAYDITVEENGNAVVLLAMDGNGTVNLPLPLDVESLLVEGGLYVQRSNGIDVSSGIGDRILVAYKTSLLTYKEGGVWNLFIEIPRLQNASVLVSLPDEALVVNTTPDGRISIEGSSKNIYWDIDPEHAAGVSVSYYYTPAGVARTDTTTEAEYTTTTATAANTAIAQTTPNHDVLTLVAATITGIAIVVAIALILHARKSGNNISGKKKVLKTLTPNELKIVTMLLDAGGEMRRNELEKNSQMAKSSLASVLYSLEKRNVVMVDKTTNTHRVGLTEWFKTL